MNGWILSGFTMRLSLYRLLLLFLSFFFFFANVLGCILDLLYKKVWVTVSFYFFFLCGFYYYYYSVIGSLSLSPIFRGTRGNWTTDDVKICFLVL